MNELAEAAKEIDSFMTDRRWSYCIVGGIAVSRWGEPRTTQGIDICVLSGLGTEQVFIQAILAHFRPRIDAAADFAELNRVLLVRARNGVAIDIALGWTPFEENMLKRATPYQLAPDTSVPIASAEDLIVSKAFAGRPQDWIDLEGIVRRQRGKLDWDYIVAELTPLCELKESPETLDELERVRKKTDG
jgi:hypothetical protein